MTDTTDLLRRQLLKGAAAAGAATMAAGALSTPAAAALRGPTAAKTLAFHNLHTGDKLQATYWEHGRFVPGALDEVNGVLRDWRTGEVTAMDPALLDYLHDLRTLLETDAPFGVISGYRSPKTNAALASKSGGVAKKSLHMRGKAIDIRVPGRSVHQVRKAALSLKRGGVGIYTKSDFVHLDTGRFRTWGS